MGSLTDAFDEASKAAPVATAAKPSTLTAAFDDAAKSADAAKTEAATPKPVEDQSILASIGAGAGNAVGRGALSVQQLLGKGASMAGDLIAPAKTLSDLVAPQKNVLQKAGDWLQTDAREGVAKLAAENAPYEAANPKANLAGEITGTVFSPVNKLIPGGAKTTTYVGAAAKGAAQGAALNTLTAPVTDDSQSFWLQKAQQAGVGGVGGAVGGALAKGLSDLAGKGVSLLSSLKNRALAGDPAEAADAMVHKTISDLGIDSASIQKERPELFDGLKTQVQAALVSGKNIDPEAVKRLTQAQLLPVPVPMLLGQITRDAMQYAKEHTLSGIQGVGEPITATLTAQNKALIANLDAIGAKSGTDVISAGANTIKTLQAADKQAQAGVTSAYNAFKQSTGKDLDVPLTGMAQDYAKTLGEFGDAIPAVIKNKFESLGLLKGTTQKTFTINDAEGLIKSINNNYDPSNRVAAKALNELRSSVQSAITDGTADTALGAEAAGLAKTARGAAKQRFDLIDSTPGLKDAIRGVEPDKFVQKHILQGNVGQIRSLMDTLGKQDPQAVESLQGSVMKFIKDRTLNGRTDANATFSSDQLKGFVSDPNTSARLKEVLGAEKMAQLKQLYEVAENALYAPVASRVNRSNTASSAANLVKGEVQGGSINSLLDLIGKTIPVLSTPAQKAQASVQSARAANLVNEAVNPSLGKQGGYAPLSSFVNPAARAGAATLQERNRKESQR